jgi:hypothetical protein
MIPSYKSDVLSEVLTEQRNFWIKIARSTQKAQLITGGRLIYFADGTIRLENAEERARRDQSGESEQGVILPETP